MSIVFLPLVYVDCKQTFSVSERDLRPISAKSSTAVSLSVSWNSVYCLHFQFLFGNGCFASLATRNLTTSIFSLPIAEMSGVPPYLSFTLILTPWDSFSTHVLSHCLVFGNLLKITTENGWFHEPERRFCKRFEIVFPPKCREVSQNQTVHWWAPFWSLQYTPHSAHFDVEQNPALQFASPGFTPIIIYPWYALPAWGLPWFCNLCSIVHCLVDSMKLGHLLDCVIMFSSFLCFWEPFENKNRKRVVPVTRKRS